jgi:hypothetical protein
MALLELLSRSAGTRVIRPQLITHHQGAGRNRIKLRGCRNTLPAPFQPISMNLSNIFGKVISIFSMLIQVVGNFSQNFPTILSPVQPEYGEPVRIK